ncbi:MAG: DUF434 domain-containing protein [Planctomycetota bacterium]|nr:DUF434 domain-containing protein [Planctomycetota bacterium]
MPDLRQHRGPHPEDQALFAETEVPVLQSATTDLSWLLTRGYARNSALKLVGDRYALRTRQRLAISRSACSADDVAFRASRNLSGTDLAGKTLWIDGYNILTSIEAALSGGVLLHTQDGCYRDMASMHGSYRKVAETLPAIEILGTLLAQWNLAACHWLLDRPVSNSGRLKELLRQSATRHHWHWHVALADDPDAELMRCGGTVASADRRVLDGAATWVNLAQTAIDGAVTDAWIVDLSTAPRNGNRKR